MSTSDRGRMTFKAGDRVVDNEGDTGTVLREEDGRVYVDGDAGTREWSYRPDEPMTLVEEEEPS